MGGWVDGGWAREWPGLLLLYRPDGYLISLQFSTDPVHQSTSPHLVRASIVYSAVRCWKLAAVRARVNERGSRFLVIQ